MDAEQIILIRDDKGKPALAVGQIDGAMEITIEEALAIGGFFNKKKAELVTYMDLDDWLMEITKTKKPRSKLKPVPRGSGNA